MQNSVTVDELSVREGLTLLDVRKPKARAASGQGMPGAVVLHPFDAKNWAGDYAGQRVVVFCVHGHEVSQGVAGYLRDAGVDAVFLEGGFEAWREAGQPVVVLDTTDD